MLAELHITNFAIIEHVDLNLADGLNIVTGETGAGKSIIIDAVDFALGGRSDASLIRAGEDKASVALVFHVPSVLRPSIRTILESNDIEIPSLEQIVMSREVRQTGRSSARINDVTTKLAVYREVGGILLDIHGQTEHLSLLSPKNHIDLLDRYAELLETREAVAELVRKWQAVTRTMQSLQQDETERERRIEMLRYQIEEIETAGLTDGEETELREERNRLANSEKLANLADEAYNALYAENEFGDSAIDAINRAFGAIDELAEIDETLSSEQETADTVLAQIEALGDAVRLYRDGLDLDPNRLNTVEERLEIITRLKRKYGDSIKAVIERGERAQQELQDIELGEERLEELEKEADSLLKSIGDLSKNLSASRQRHAEKLSARVEEQLKQLRMEGARFEVSISQEEDPDGCYVDDERLAFDATGIDRVEFMLAANMGEPLRPLAQVASGGETARIMLALKTVLSNADQTPTLIFDEVDQGIGGRLGLTVGEKLWKLANKHQVMVVTHLAQIVGFADHHFKVDKITEEKRTKTNVALLPEDERLKEMAEMLGGLSDRSLENARELYQSAIKLKNPQTA